MWRWERYVCLDSFVGGLVFAVMYPGHAVRTKLNRGAIGSARRNGVHTLGWWHVASAVIVVLVAYVVAAYLSGECRRALQNLERGGRHAAGFYMLVCCVLASLIARRHFPWGLPGRLLMVLHSEVFWFAEFCCTSGTIGGVSYGVRWMAGASR